MARTRSDIAPRILEAARERFLREGVDGASLRAIAADAGTSIGMVYYYFPTKDDLFFAVVEETYAALLGELERALAPGALADKIDLPERLRRLYHRIGAMTDREATTVRLVLREVLVSSDRLARLIERFQRGHIPLVLGALRDGRAEGAIDPELPPLVLALATFALGAAPQFILRHARGRLPAAGVPEGDALGDLLVKILLDGIAAPARRPKRKSTTRRT